MEMIGKKDIDETEPLPKSEMVLSSNEPIEPMTEEDFKRAIIEMSNPVEYMKAEAANLKHYLDHRRERELKNGVITDKTRKMAKDLHELLEKIQKALHGDKSVNLNLNASIKPSILMAQMRKAKAEEVDDADDS